MPDRKRRGLPIHGWICLDKPDGMTSTQAVGAVKRITRAAKAGHGGTLDPLATGVLPIALGEATKTVSYVMNATKTYRFTVRFGEERDTDDADGAVVATSMTRPETADIDAALGAYLGEIEQTPPRFAALKIDGQRAYDLARRGEEVDHQPRPVVIHDLRMLDRPDPDHAAFEMVCGRGTYVRALARDLGRDLDCRGHVVALRRTAVGPFTIEQAVSISGLEELVANDSLPQALIPVTTALADIPALTLTEPQAQRLRSGQPVRITPALIGEDALGGPIRAMQGDRLVAIARVQAGEVNPLRVFNL